LASNLVEINPKLIIWAIEVSQINYADIVIKFPRIGEWVSQETAPTFKQLQALCKFLHVPFGYMFLDEPPELNIIKSEFRTISSNIIGSPSQALQDVLLDAQYISSWMRDYRIQNGVEALEYVGCLASSRMAYVDYSTIVTKIRDLLQLEADWSKQIANNKLAFNDFRKRIESIGTIVIVKGFVRTNTRRRLSINEFRAFALCDEYAPTIFINSKDSDNGRLFSIIHEFAHILLGTDHLENANRQPETLCNKAAINTLAPLKLVKDSWKNIHEQNIIGRILRISDLFKTSPHAMAIHLLNMDYIRDSHLQEIIRITQLSSEKPDETESGGNYWNTTLFSISPNFINAVAAQVNSGRTQYTEAFRLLNISKMSTFDSLIERVNK